MEARFLPVHFLLQLVSMEVALSVVAGQNSAPRPAAAGAADQAPNTGPILSECRWSHGRGGICAARPSMGQSAYISHVHVLHLAIVNTVNLVSIICVRLCLPAAVARAMVYRCTLGSIAGGPAVDGVRYWSAVAGVRWLTGSESGESVV